MGRTLALVAILVAMWGLSLVHSGVRHNETRVAHFQGPRAAQTCSSFDVNASHARGSSYECPVCIFLLNFHPQFVPPSGTVAQQRSPAGVPPCADALVKQSFPTLSRPRAPPCMLSSAGLS